MNGLLMAQPAAAPAAGGDLFGGMFPMVVIFVIFYFLLIRPQQKKAKEHQQLLNELRRNDRVITGGGIYGTVMNVRGDIVDVKISENVQVEVAKPSISAVMKQKDVVTPEIVK